MLFSWVSVILRSYMHEKDIKLFLEGLLASEGGIPTVNINEIVGKIYESSEKGRFLQLHLK